MRILLSVIFAMAIGAAAQAAPINAIERLRNDAVSRLEWGIERFRLALLDNFSRDPLTLAPLSPPFFINVNYVADNDTILIEVGRTFGAAPSTAANDLCRQYLQRVRGFLAVDNLGNPVANGASSLTRDYFLAAGADADDDGEFARALDSRVRMRGLVAAPTSGVFSICGAPLIDGPIRFVD